MSADLREFAIRTASGEVLHVSCGRVRVTSRGDLLAIVGGYDEHDERSRCVLAMPVGTWAGVSDRDFGDAPPPAPPRRVAA